MVGRQDAKTQPSKFSFETNPYTSPSTLQDNRASKLEIVIYSVISTMAIKKSTPRRSYRRPGKPIPYQLRPRPLQPTRFYRFLDIFLYPHMFEDLEKYTGNIFAEDLEDNDFDPSTISDYSSDSDSSLASDSTLSIASSTELFGLEVRTPLQLPRETSVIPILSDTPETSETEINEELSQASETTYESIELEGVETPESQSSTTAEDSEPDTTNVSPSPVSPERPEPPKPRQSNLSPTSLRTLHQSYQRHLQSRRR